jgi:positive regulator of sigma E activity
MQTFRLILLNALFFFIIFNITNLTLFDWNFWIIFFSILGLIYNNMFYKGNI